MHYFMTIFKNKEQSIKETLSLNPNEEDIISFHFHNTHRKRDKECKPVRTTYGFSRTSPQIDPRVAINVWIYVWILTKLWTVGIHVMHGEGKTHLIMWAMKANGELHIKYKLNKTTRSNFCLLFSAQTQAQIKTA